jgi:ribosomal protein L11 methyltransferase
LSNRPDQLWQASVTVPKADVGYIEDALFPDALSVSSFETAADHPLWLVQAIFDSEPDRGALRAGLGSMAKRIDVRAVPAKNWVAESQALTPPVSAGRYYVHGSHDSRHASPSRTDVVIDAGMAFGTGRHASTRGCLIAMDRLRRARRFARILDLGTGSGVLAIAAAKTWRRTILATDSDPIAVAVAVENAHINRVHSSMRGVTACGFAHRAIRKFAPFDLILANILARPLAQMAPAMRQNLAKHGVVVLSGLLAKQENWLLGAYRRQGMRPFMRIAREGWHTLVLMA